MVKLLTLLLLLASPVAAQERETLHLDLILDAREDTPLEGEMILATLRGVYREDIAKEELKLRSMTDFDWARLGQDDWSDQRIDGRAARVFERRIAFYPKRAGLLEVLPIAHELVIIGEGGQRETVLVRSAPVQIDVGERPAGAGEDWFPVRALELSDTWSTEPSELEDGQIVTRRVVLRALGATPEMMPEQPALREPWLITFAPPAERDFQVTAQGPVTTLVWTWSLRPITGEPGVIPQVTIPYFDTAERAARTATIAAAPIGYASFADNAASGWRKDAGVGRLHLAFLAATFLLVISLALRGRSGSSTAIARLRSRIHSRRVLRRLRRFADHGDAAGFRTVARGLLDPSGQSLDGLPILRPLDRMLFGGDVQAGAADLQNVFRDVRSQVKRREDSPSVSVGRNAR